MISSVLINLYICFLQQKHPLIKPMLMINISKKAIFRPGLIIIFKNIITAYDLICKLIAYHSWISLRKLYFSNNSDNELVHHIPGEHILCYGFLKDVQIFSKRIIKSNII